MKDFEENFCRLCDKAFCCKKCRLKHEKKVHDIIPECDICFYGKTNMRGISQELLDHIENVHLPLHCIYCKKLFLIIDDLTNHDNRCDGGDYKNKIPRTPVTPSIKSYESSPILTPIYENVITSQHFGVTNIIVVTSTPMQGNAEGKNIVELVDQSEIKYKSSIKSSERKKDLKRVTFSETPTFDLDKKNKYLTNEDQIENDISNNDCSENTYYSAIAEKENSVCNSNSLWESAIDTCESIENEINENPSEVSSPQVLCIINDKGSVKTAGIWSSMTNLVRSVIQGFAATSENTSCKGNGKRLQPHSPDADSICEKLPLLKRRKFSSIKCRRTIREISPLEYIRIGRSTGVDKSTQTDSLILEGLNKINKSTMTD